MFLPKFAVMAALLLLLLLLAGAGPAASGERVSATTGCVTDLDCELTGRCDAASGRCDCHPGWIGPTCGALDLLPAPRRGAWPARRPVPPEYWGDGATPVSWGGTIGSPMTAADSRWHIGFDITLDHISRVSEPCATPPAPYAVLYLVGC